MWQFSSPEIIFGEDALSRLAEIQARQLLIVTDNTLLEAGLLQMILERLTPAGVEYELFSDVEPEPSIQTMERVHRLIDQVSPEAVLALGGGSVLDVAKVAWFLHEHPHVALDEISIFDAYESPKSELIAVPTTSGSGADVTVGVVLTDQINKRKVSIYARELQPSMIIVDPVLSKEMPRQLTANTGMDAISHAIEAYTGAWHNDFSDGLSIQALRLAFRYLPRAWADGSDEVAREHMHNAATIAGLAITNSSVALGHALAHSLGAIFPQPHGRAIGVMLPYSMAFTANGGGTRYRELADALGLAAGSEEEGLSSLLEALRDLSAKLLLPATIRETSVGESDFEAALPALASAAGQDHQMLTSLRVPTERELVRLFQCAYNGERVDF